MLPFIEMTKIAFLVELDVLSECVEMIIIITKTDMNYLHCLVLFQHCWYFDNGITQHWSGTNSMETNWSTLPKIVIFFCFPFCFPKTTKIVSEYNVLVIISLVFLSGVISPKFEGWKREETPLSAFKNCSTDVKMGTKNLYITHCRSSSSWEMEKCFSLRR